MPTMFDATVVGRVGIDLYSLDFNTPLKDVRRFAKYVGGGAANIAVGLAKLGLKSAVISGVGDDDLGEFVIEYLTRENVESKYIRKFPDGKTGIVFAEVFPLKESKFIFYREKAADLLITKDDVENEAVRESKVLVTTGTGLSANPSREATLVAMQLAKKNSKTVVFNLDWRPSLWKGVNPSDRTNYYAQAIELADILIGNDKEFMAATGMEGIESALLHLRNQRDKLLILTSGERGSRAYHGEKVVEAAPFKVDSLKTLGAGDGNLAGFLYGYLNRWDLYKSLRFGNAVGAQVVTRHSCSEAMPTYDETMMFIEASGGF
jgi:5-dehydro-2-deoxygluconokinase